MEIIARLANLPGALPGACAQGLIWGIMAIGVYLTYRILDVAAKNNSSRFNYGIVLEKYTGARGKSGTSDASAEFVGEVARIFDSNNVNWQLGELGKVDEGGGGTVAKYIANLGVQVIDVGVPVLSMHAPFEVVAKLDVYAAFKGFKAFLES